MVVAVALALHDKLRGIPRQENDGVLRLYIFLAGLTIQFSHTLASCGIVADESAVVLVAVQFKHVNDLAIRTPSNIGEISVCGVSCLQIDGILCL